MSHWYRYYSEQKSDSYGYQLFPQSAASIHTYLANFKVDVDIHGPKNIFETLDIVGKMEPNIARVWFSTVGYYLNNLN